MNPAVLQFAHAAHATHDPHQPSTASGAAMLDTRTTTAAGAGLTTRHDDAPVPTALVLAQLRDQHQLGADGHCRTCHPGTCPGQRAALYLDACDHGSAWTGTPPAPRPTAA